MKHRESLFQLIRSLNKNEKGYFKKFVSSYSSTEKSNYIRLFDSIGKQEVYDERKIKKQFAHSNLSKNLSVAKNYLYNAILKSLRSYYKEDSVDAVVNDLLKDVGVLQKKALYDHCGELLEKARLLALKHEKHLLLLEIHSQQFKLERLGLKEKKFSRESAVEKHREETRILDQYKNILDYRLLMSKLITIDPGLTNQHKTTFDEIVQSPLLANDIIPLTYQAGTLYYSLQSRIHNFYLYKLEKGYDLNKQQIAFMESHGAMMKEDTNEYCTVLYSILLSQLDLKKYDDFKSSLPKLKNFACSSPDMEIRIFQRVVTVELMYFIQSVHLQEGLLYVESILKKLKKNEELLSKGYLLAIYDSISLLYFYNKNYWRSLYYVNQILNSKADLLIDLKCFSHVFFMIIHYETGNIDEIERMHKKAEKFIKDNRGTGGFEWPVLKFMETLPSIKSELKLKEAFRQLKLETRKFTTSPQDKVILDFFDVSLWAQSKEEAVELSTLMRAKSSILFVQ